MGGGEKGCDAQSAAVFIIGLVAGTGCIIVAKMLFEMKAVGSTGEVSKICSRPTVVHNMYML